MFFYHWFECSTREVSCEGRWVEGLTFELAEHLYVCARNVSHCTATVARGQRVNNEYLDGSKKKQVSFPNPTKEHSWDKCTCAPILISSYKSGGDPEATTLRGTCSKVESFSVLLRSQSFVASAEAFIRSSNWLRTTYYTLAPTGCDRELFANSASSVGCGVSRDTREQALLKSSKGPKSKIKIRHPRDYSLSLYLRTASWGPQGVAVVSVRRTGRFAQCLSSLPYSFQRSRGSRPMQMVHLIRVASDVHVYSELVRWSLCSEDKLREIVYSKILARLIPIDSGLTKTAGDKNVVAHDEDNWADEVCCGRRAEIDWLDRYTIWFLWTSTGSMVKRWLCGYNHRTTHRKHHAPCSCVHCDDLMARNGSVPEYITQCYSSPCSVFPAIPSVLFDHAIACLVQIPDLPGHTRRHNMVSVRCYNQSTARPPSLTLQI